jgi:RNA polymerase sigma factor (sigma-70 family)
MLSHTREARAASFFAPAEIEDGKLSPAAHPSGQQEVNSFTPSDSTIESSSAHHGDHSTDQRPGDVWPMDAAPVIRGVVSRRLGSCADAEDVRAQAMLQLVERLHEGPHEGLPDSIEGFSGYVATVAHHACDHYLRSKYPLRWRLRNRIRYALEHDPSFALWKTADGVWRCGRHGWQSWPPGVPPTQQQLMVSDRRQPRDLLLQVFDLSRGPLELAAVVDLAASVWAVPLSAREEMDTLETIPDPHPAADVAIEHRRDAARAWAHIRDLPARQRQALLLNLKDDAIRMLVTTGTASLRAIAEAVEMGVDALASVWNELPLADNEIAVRLGCTRQQVINLRMAARKRLTNKLSGWR